MRWASRLFICLPICIFGCDREAPPSSSPSSHPQGETTTSTVTADRSIQHAAYTGDVEQVERFLNEGVNINSKDKAGLTALHWASYKGQVEAIQTLLENGARVNISQDALRGRRWEDASVGSPIDLAARGNHADAFQILVEYGAEIQDSHLRWAISHGNKELSAIVLELEADVDLSRHLLRAAAHDAKAIVRLFFDHNADANTGVLNWTDTNDRRDAYVGYYSGVVPVNI